MGQQGGSTEEMIGGDQGEKSGPFLNCRDKFCSTPPKSSHKNGTQL